ncbi:MAG: VWA domain-containing protein [Vicinamibacterales bacterium]
MHLSRSAAPLLLAICATALVSARQDQRPAPFRSGARTVAVYATVTDKDGRLVPDLGREAFAIRDGGKPQPLTVFANEVQPISIVLLLDRSGSMRGNNGLVAQAAAAFVERLGPGDKARIGSFADRIEIAPPDFTDDQAVLRRVLQATAMVTGPTPLWNAIDEGLDALHAQTARKVVLVFSDGGNSPAALGSGNHSLFDVMRRAQQDDVMIYAIGLQTTMLGGRGAGGMGGLTSQRPDPGLARIADETGGGYFELTRGDNLAATFTRVADELHHQYALGFEPPRLDDKMHTLEVRVTQKGAKVRARTDYFAGRPSDGR